MLLKIWLNTFSLLSNEPLPHVSLKQHCACDEGDRRPKRRGRDSCQEPAATAQGAAGAGPAGGLPARAEKPSPAEGPDLGFLHWSLPHPQGGPGEQEGLGMNGGVHLAAEGTRGVGYGAI